MRGQKSVCRDSDTIDRLAYIDHSDRVLDWVEPGQVRHYIEHVPLARAGHELLAMELEYVTIRELPKVVLIEHMFAKVRLEEIERLRAPPAYQWTFWSALDTFARVYRAYDERIDRTTALHTVRVSQCTDLRRRWKAPKPAEVNI